MGNLHILLRGVEIMDFVIRSEKGLLVECDEPQHAITPGQVAVLYDGDWCLGSGIIDNAL